MEVVALLVKERMPALRLTESLIESPNKALPVISKTPVVVVAMPTPKPLDTSNWEVEAKEDTDKLVDVAQVDVENVERRFNIVDDEELEMRPPVKVKSPVPDSVRRVERLSTVKADVEAYEETLKLVEVALVDVEQVVKRLVIVLDAELTIIPPLKVAKPVKVEAPVTVRVEDKERVVID